VCSNLKVSAAAVAAVAAVAAEEGTAVITGAVITAVVDEVVVRVAEAVEVVQEVCSSLEETVAPESKWSLCAMTLLRMVAAVAGDVAGQDSI
jgi:hypothetical protein